MANVVCFAASVVFLLSAMSSARGGTPAGLCGRLLLSGLDGKHVAYVQLGGIYELQNFTWNEFPVFKRSNIYLYYEPVLNQMLFGQKKGTPIGLGATLHNFNPSENWLSNNKKFPFNKILDRWIQYNHRSKAYHYVAAEANIQLTCVDEQTTECSSGAVYLNGLINQDTPDGKIIPLNIPSLFYYEIVPEISLGSRPVYRRVNGPGEVYLFFDTALSVWQIGPDYNSSNVFMFVSDVAYFPWLITGQWKYYSGSAWKTHSTLSVRCKGTKVNTGENCETSNVCEHNSSCSMVDTDQMMCDCQDGWFGIKCEKPKAKCPDLPGKTGVQSTPLLWAGTVQSSIATHGCNEGLKPEFYQSTCVADREQSDSSSPTGHWVAGDVCYIPSTTVAPSRVPTRSTLTTASTRYKTTSSWYSSNSDDKPKPWGEPYWVWIVVLIVVILLQVVLPIYLYFHLDWNGVDKYLDKKHKQVNEIGAGASSDEHNEGAEDHDDEELDKWDKEDIEVQKALRGVSFCRLMSLCLQISVWIWLPFTIGCGATKCGAYGDSMSTLVITAAIVIPLGYLWIICETFRSHESQYLAKLGHATSVAETIASIRKAMPTLVMMAVSYHYETRTRTVYSTDANGHTTSRIETYQERVVTHTDAEAINFRFWRDISKDKVTMISKYRVTKIRMEKSIVPGDQETRQSMDQAIEEFQERNRHLDVYMDYSLQRHVPGFVKRLAAYTDQAYKPWWMSRLWFWIATLLGISWAYRWWFNASTGNAEYLVRKEIFLSAPNEAEGVMDYDVQSETVREKVRNSLAAGKSTVSAQDTDNKTESSKENKQRDNKQRQEETTHISINMNNVQNGNRA